MSVTIAKATPFEGAPHINMPKIYGICTGKENFYRIPVTGKRPITITVDGLADGLSFENGIIKGFAKADCEFTVTVTAENVIGKDSKSVIFKSSDEVLLTPLLGFTSWNAFGDTVSQADMERTAEHFDKLGLAEYGYNYVNVDSGWQEKYGGEYNAIMPNKNFPDMKAMCDKIHSLGFKCGIYSTPMVEAWGCPPYLEKIPGCTTGEPDPKYLETLRPGCYPIGLEHHEEDCVKQWDEWGFDYLKYDWQPTDIENTELMRAALAKAKRKFAFCPTTRCNVNDSDYWTKYCNAWRDGPDSQPAWKRLTEYLETVDKWKPHVKQGHFYDLDMLEIGMTVWNDRYFTDHEILFAYTMRAFFLSPIQLSCRLEQLTDFEFDLFCNDEIIALHQDSLCDYPELIEEVKKENTDYKVYQRQLENGDTAIAIFNTGDDLVNYSKELGREVILRDVWAKESFEPTSTLKCVVKSHCVKVFRISKI